MDEKDIEPEIGPFSIYIRAFDLLSSDRPVAFEIGEIPFSSIWTYHNIYRIDDDFDEFLYYIKLLDVEFINHHRRKRKSEEQVNSGKSK